MFGELFPVIRWIFRDNPAARPEWSATGTEVGPHSGISLILCIWHISHRTSWCFCRCRFRLDRQGCLRDAVLEDEFHCMCTFGQRAQIWFAQRGIQAARCSGIIWRRNGGAVCFYAFKQRIRLIVTDAPVDFILRRISWTRPAARILAAGRVQDIRRNIKSTGASVTIRRMRCLKA